MVRLTRGVNRFLLLLLSLALLSCTASAVGTGTLYAVNATDVVKENTETVSLVLGNDYNPKLGSIGFKIYYDSDVATVVAADAHPGVILPNDLSTNPLTVGGALSLTGGLPNGEPILANITFKSMVNDGSKTDIGLYVESARDMSLPNPLPVTLFTQNGTFSTKDEVAPKITPKLRDNEKVSSTFSIAGAIYDVGGVKTAAEATLENKTHKVPFVLNLAGSAPDYIFDQTVTWPVEDGVTLTVTATDASGNKGTWTGTIDVVDVGFSDPIPEPGSYINEIPDSASVFITKMNLDGITMYLGNAICHEDLDVSITDNCAEGSLPRDLADGEYWVNVSGIDGYENPQFLNWTFTLDTTNPKIDSFTITDSDGDGYIEAGEDLTLSWKVTDLNFEHVALVDKDTDEMLWCCDSSKGSKK